MFKTKSGREISFLGEENANEIRCIEKNDYGVQTLADLFGILLESWCKETAYPSCQHDYVQENDPTYGQCAITATIVYDLFGGTINRVRFSDGGTHYFNRIDGRDIDLTSDQFDLYDIEVNYEKNEEMSREYCNKNPDTLKRYQLLVTRMSEVARGR